jgi:hypothetical protein
MAKSSNIVHQYFKKQLENATILVKVNPILYTGTEITVMTDGKTEVRDMEFDQDILDDLKADEFVEASPLEFNLYYNGLV